MKPIDAQILFMLNQGIHIPPTFPQQTDASKVIQQLSIFKGISDEAVNLRMKSLILSEEDCNVLITGPSGHGKEILARAIASEAKHITIENMAAIPENLFESQLFGHKKGAFTGASQDFPGLVKTAHGGTLILDELGEMPQDTQAKLLRVIETGEYRPVGSTVTEHVEVRFIATTHALDKLRVDLRWRLGEVHVEIPHLKERLQDLQPITVALNDGESPRPSTQDTILQCVRRDNFGGVRELHAIIKQESFRVAEIELKQRYNTIIHNNIKKTSQNKSTLNT